MTLTQKAVIEARRLRLCGHTLRTLAKMEQDRHVRWQDTGLSHHEGRI